MAAAAPLCSVVTTHDSIQMGDYTVTTESMRRPLGSGKFGKVYSATGKTGKHFAAKHFDGRDHNEEYLKEMKALHQAPQNHPNIIKMYAQAWDEHKDLWLIMEYCEHGNLHQYFKTFRDDFSNIYLKLDMMCQTASGIKYLHEAGTIHRNLAPNNILLASNNGAASGPVIKITDFTQSKCLDPYDSSTMSTDVGSELYFKAPEFFRLRSPGEKLKYKRSIDIYSTGLVFLAMLQKLINGYLKPQIEGEQLNPSDARRPIGELMYTRDSQGSTHPVNVVQERQENSQTENMVRRIVQRATLFQPTYRISVTEMYDDLMEIKENLNGALGRPEYAMPSQGAEVEYEQGQDVNLH